jgi:hypothetical protein
METCPVRARKWYCARLAEIGTESALTETANGGEGAKRISSHLEKALGGSEGKSGNSTQDERGVECGSVTLPSLVLSIRVMLEILVEPSARY